MEYFLNSLGDITIGNVAILLCTVIFLFRCYKKVEKYFSEKAIKEKEYDERIKKVISQAENYPKWHEQSLCIQKKFGNSIDNLDRKMDKLQKLNDEGMALTWRYRILRFDDEVLHDDKHTKEHFDQILEDITKYERFCKDNPDFENNKAYLATVVYLMANRESVKVNFLAHVKQNMINATFGICADRYKATEKQKEQIKEKKAEVLNALRKCETIDDMISCEAAKPFISSSWLDTPESMIVRKMLNNATRKYPKNYDTMANKAFIEMDEIYQNSRAEIAENENSQPFEVVADVEAKEEPSFVTEG